MTTPASKRPASSWARRGLVGVLAAALLFGATAGTALAAPVAPDGSGSSGSSDSSDSEQRSGSAAEQQSDDDDGAAQQQAQTRARAEAAAARAQQRAAEAAQRGQAAWESHGRPHQMIIVRPTSVDSLTDGRLTRRTPRAGAVVTLAQLDTAVPSGWITSAGGTVQLGAALVLSPGVNLDLGGGGVTTVRLVGGAGPADAASIYTGSGQLTVRGVTVNSVDPASGQPVPAGPGRPFVYVAGGRLDATDATFTDLGTPATDPQDRAAISFGANSTGSLVRTTVLRGGTGVQLSRSNGVRLEGVTVAESGGDGLVLQGDQGTTLISVRAERNGDNGVQVSGPSSARPITGISTTGNAKFGLAVISQQAPQIVGVVTQADRTGGLQLSGDTAPVVTGFSAVDQPIGVLTHVSSGQVTLNQLRISGGGRGVAIEKTTDGLVLSGSTIERAQTGVSVGGKHVELRDVLVADNQSGVRVERGAIGVTATATRVAGGQDGIVLVPGTTGVVLRDVVVDGVANNGVRTASPNAQIFGGRISNSTTGIDAEAAATINGTEIEAVNVGIRSRSPEPVNASNVTVSAMTSGVNVEDGTGFVLTDSRVDALEAVTGQASYQGTNRLSLPPLNVLGVIGIPLVLLALLLDQLQRFRQRRRGGFDRRRLPPRLQAGAH